MYFENSIKKLCPMAVILNVTIYRKMVSSANWHFAVIESAQKVYVFIAHDVV